MSYMGKPGSVPFGGTGDTTLTSHGVLLGEGTSAIGATSAGTAGQLLLSGGASADPQFVTPTAGSGLSVTANASTHSYAISAPVSIANGGTNATSMTNTDGVVYYDGTRLLTTAVGSATQVLTSNGAGLAPTFQAASGGGVPSIAGTANQITETGSPGATTLSIPSTFIAPGSIAATTTLTATSGNITATSGNLALPSSTSSVGQIVWGSGASSQTMLVDAHDSVYIGNGAGAIAAGATNNVGIGRSSLASASNATNQSNVAIGYHTLTAATIGQANTAIGTDNSAAITTGNNNTSVGNFTNIRMTTGIQNIIIGTDDGSGTGGAGYNYTGAESNNILIQNLGVNGESHVIRIGTNGSGSLQQNVAYIAGTVHGATGFVADAGNLALPTTSSSAGQITINSNAYFHGYGGTGNVFAGSSSGNFTLTSTDATCVGFQTGLALTSGANDTLIGNQAGAALTSGTGNTAVGFTALQSETTHNYNTAIGSGALNSLNGAGENTALGRISLGQLTTGARNTALGYQTGGNYTTSESDNITIGHAVLGTAAESNTLRIGKATGTGSGQLNQAFIAGIQGITVTGAAVLVSTSDQLGVAVSAARFKENIVDMGDYSSKIYDLRPVTFNLKNDTSGIKTPGLIAEECAQVYPDLIVYDPAGAPLTIKYHELPALLLNEIKKLKAEIQRQSAELDELKNWVATH